MDRNICGDFLENISKRKRKQFRAQYWKHQQRFAGRIHSNNPSQINHNRPHNSTRSFEHYTIDYSKNSTPNWRNNNNLRKRFRIPPVGDECASSPSSGSPVVTFSETTVKTDDCLLNAADSSTTNEDFKNEGQENHQKRSCFSTGVLENSVLKHETNVFENGKSFQEDVEILLDACSRIQTRAFYLDKIESLHKNHIQVLLKEKDKCNIEFEQVQKKRKENRKLINTRLDTMGKVLGTLTASRNISDLNIHKFLGIQKSKIQAIRSKLKDCTCCESLRSELKKNREEQKTIARKSAVIDNIHKLLQQKENELNTIKKDLEDKVNTIRQHSHYEQNRNLEISKLKQDVDKYKIQLTQMQEEKEAVCKELNSEIIIIQNNLESNVNVTSRIADTECELQKVENNLNPNINLSKPALSQQEGIINVSTIKEANVVSEQAALTKCQLVQAFHKENKVSVIQETCKMQEKYKAELSQLQVQFAGTQQELENVKKILNSKINIIKQKIQYEQNIMEQLNKAKENEKTFENQLAQTQIELEAVKKQLNNEVQILEQKAQHEEKEIEFSEVKEVNILQNQLLKTQQLLENVKKTLNSKVNIIEQKVQHEHKIMEQLNEAEEEGQILKNQLAQTHNELEAVKKELSGKVHIVEQALNDKKEIELDRVKEVGSLQSQLTGTLRELEETRKDLSYKVITIQEKAQQEQKIMKELNEAEEGVKLLRSQLAATQHDLEIVRKELNDRVNQQENIEKAMKVEFSKIRLMLMKKLGITDQNSQNFKNYMKEGYQCIVPDIQRLIEDKVQSLNENTLEAVIGSSSNVLKVTENELHLLILIASILKVVPFSASTDFIYSFVAEVDNVISRQHVEGLLRKFPILFKEESVGGGSSNKNWRYLYLKPIITI